MGGGGVTLRGEVGLEGAGVSEIRRVVGRRGEVVRLRCHPGLWRVQTVQKAPCTEGTVGSRAGHCVSFSGLL